VSATVVLVLSIADAWSRKLKYIPKTVVASSMARAKELIHRQSNGGTKRAAA
jgi:hypothetical protein